MYYIFIFIDIS